MKRLLTLMCISILGLVSISCGDDDSSSNCYVQTLEDGSEYREVYTYDDQNRLTELSLELFFNGQYEAVRTYTNTYNSSGQLSQTVFYDLFTAAIFEMSAPLVITSTFQYESGDQISQINYTIPLDDGSNNDGGLEISSIEVDENLFRNQPTLAKKLTTLSPAIVNKIQVQQKNSRLAEDEPTSIELTDRITYDNNGNISMIAHYGWFEDPQESVVSEYNYDEKGNLIGMNGLSFFIPIQPEPTILQSATYDDKKHLLNGKMPQVVSLLLFEESVVNNPIQEIYTIIEYDEETGAPYANGSEVYSMSYEYNDNGYPTKVTTSSVGQSNTVETLTYDCK